MNNFCDGRRGLGHGGRRGKETACYAEARPAPLLTKFPARCIIAFMAGTGQFLDAQLKATIAPQMIESMKLAAMPAVELREEILKEAEKNPALEVVFDPAASREIPPQGGNALYREGSPRSFASGGRASAEKKSDERRNFFEKVLAREETLQEHLASQLSEIKLPPKTRSLALAVITSLDGRGFLAVPPETLPGGGNEALLDEALSVVRRLDPQGCAARDALDSLAIQAAIRAESCESPDDKERYSLIASILKSGMKLEGKARPESLKSAAKREYGKSISPEEAAAIEELLRSLEPYPGRNFAQGEAMGEDSAGCIAPDIIVVKKDGAFHARMNDDEIPVIRVSPAFERFEKESPQGSRSPHIKEEKAFVRDSLRDARWFIGALKRRRKTVLKVAAAVIAMQKPFFEQGPKFLQPLRMLDVAEELGFHEATVSRAVSGKYLQCEWGVFSLRHFFSARAKAATMDGAGRSKEGIKEIIREMLKDAEKKPSDREIAEQLAERGIQIARRTVAKYRGELGM